MLLNPYKRGSRGAKRLKEALRERSCKVFIGQAAPKNPHALVINWGNSEFDYTHEHIINDPFWVYQLSNKIRFFETVGDDPDVLKWTRNPEKAKEFGVVVCRQKVEASGGAGIVIWNGEGDLPVAPLYTKYQPKTHEYRLHLFRDLAKGYFDIKLIQRKVFVKTDDMPEPKDWQVRNHDNGFIFQTHHDWGKIPPAVMDAAQRVMNTHFKALHFVALDVMYHQKSGAAFVIEGNTAPGLENNTVEIYADCFKAYDDKHKQRLMR